MKRRYSTVVATSLVLALGVGLLEAHAGKGRHSHAIRGVYTASPPRPIAPFSAASAIAPCPRRMSAVGGGGLTDGISYLNHLEIAPDGVGVIYINPSDTASTIQAEASCLKTRTTSTAASAASGVAELRAKLKERAAELDPMVKRK
jgi:hypothetical protein